MPLSISIPLSSPPRFHRLLNYFLLGGFYNIYIWLSGSVRCSEDNTHTTDRSNHGTGGACSNGKELFCFMHLLWLQIVIGKWLSLHFLPPPNMPQSLFFSQSSPSFLPLCSALLCALLVAMAVNTNRPLLLFEHVFVDVCACVRAYACTWMLSLSLPPSNRCVFVFTLPPCLSFTLSGRMSYIRSLKAFIAEAFEA